MSRFHGALVGPSLVPIKRTRTGPVLTPPVSPGEDMTLEGRRQLALFLVRPCFSVFSYSWEVIHTCIKARPVVSPSPLESV